MTERLGRVLALDLGEARIGVALSDPLGLTAQPAGTIRSRGRELDLESIRELVLKHEVGCVVVGYPLLLSGKAGTRAQDAEKMAGELRTALGDGVRVELWDERLTTAQAERVLLEGDVNRRRKKKVIDTLSAVVLLQSYLEARGLSSLENGFVV